MRVHNNRAGWAVFRLSLIVIDIVIGRSIIPEPKGANRKEGKGLVTDNLSSSRCKMKNVFKGRCFSNVELRVV